MVSFKSTAVYMLGASTAAAQQIVSHPHKACSAIADNFSYEDVTVNFATFVPAGTNISLDHSGELTTCGRPNQIVPVDLCRVAMFVKTSEISNITLEAWLPTNWTGRFLSTGNGGLSGCIQYEDIAYGTQYGFATVGANNGHNGTSGNAFYKSAEVVKDFSWRSVHTGVVVGKAITQTYCQDDYTKSYYLGCSTGGRQGFKEVQKFPHDFDGVVVGAPAVGFNNLTTFLTPDKWALVHDDILNQCDDLDGVADGILEDPDLCTYRPVTLQCASDATDTSACLTAPQVETVRKVFSRYYGDGANNQSALIFPRMQPGSELSDAFIYYNGQPFP